MKALDLEETRSYPDVSEFLKKCNCQQYLKKFIDYGFDELEVIKEITDDNMREIGLEDFEIQLVQNRLSDLNGKKVRFSETNNKVSSGTDPIEFPNSNNENSFVTKPKSCIVEESKNNTEKRNELEFKEEDYISSRETKKPISKSILYSGGANWKVVDLSSKKLDNFEICNENEKKYCFSCYCSINDEEFIHKNKSFCSHNCKSSFILENSTNCRICSKVIEKSEDFLFNGLFLCTKCRPSAEVQIEERIGQLSFSKFQMYKEIDGDDEENEDIYAKRRKYMIE